MPRSLALGVLLGVLVFAAGFALGTARVLAIEPALGHRVAIVLELPVIALATWFAAGFVVRRLPEPRGMASRALVGLVGFVVLQAGEIATGVFAFGRPLADVMAGYARADGLVALGLQAMVIVFPLLVRTSSKGAR
jgi:hypothetical protein